MAKPSRKNTRRDPLVADAIKAAELALLALPSAGDALTLLARNGLQKFIGQARPAP